MGNSWAASHDGVGLLMLWPASGHLSEAVGAASRSEIVAGVVAQLSSAGITVRSVDLAPFENDINQSPDVPRVPFRPTDNLLWAVRPAAIDVDRLQAALPTSPQPEVLGYQPHRSIATGWFEPDPRTRSALLRRVLRSPCRSSSPAAIQVAGPEGERWALAAQRSVVAIWLDQSVGLERAAATLAALGPMSYGFVERPAERLGAAPDPTDPWYGWDVLQQVESRLPRVPVRGGVLVRDADTRITHAQVHLVNDSHEPCFSGEVWSSRERASNDMWIISTE
jgi:hypothetical protein